MHGWASWPGMWRPLWERLPEYRHECAEFSGCKTADDFAAAAEAAIARLRSRMRIQDVKEPRVEDAAAASHEPDDGEALILAGWSMGALLALQLALDPDRRARLGIDGVVSISGTLRFTSDAPELGWPDRIVARMQKRLGKEPEATLEAFRALLWTAEERERMTAPSGSFPPLERTSVGQTQPGRPESEVPEQPCAHTDMSVEGLQAGLAYLRQTDLRERWETREGETGMPPLLWIHGRQDQVCPFGAAAASASVGGKNNDGAELAPYRLVELPDAGHAPIYFSVDRVAGEIRSFLDEQIQ
nr:alpha/beta hydrolase [Paenibacillus turpanensis]